MSKLYEEMNAQYGALRQTETYINNRINIIKRFFEEEPFETVCFMGSGSSYSVAKSYEAMYRNLTGKAAMSAVSGAVMLDAARYSQALCNGVVFTVSRSGSTSEMINAVKAVKENTPVRVVSITCAEDSPMSELSDLNLCMPWAFDEAVCQTRTVSNLYAAGVLIAAGLGGREDVAQNLSATIAGLEVFAKTVEKEMLALSKIKWERAVILADGEAAGVAEEGALAFKEICKVNSNQYGLLDVRHGPIVTIDSPTLVIADAGAAGGHELKLIEELCAKHATVITMTGEEKEIPGVYKNFAFGAELDIVSRGLALLIICQYAAYYKALYKGVNPDVPDGLDAWIKL